MTEMVVMMVVVLITAMIAVVAMVVSSDGLLELCLVAFQTGTLCPLTLDTNLLRGRE